MGMVYQAEGGMRFAFPPYVLIQEIKKGRQGSGQK
jgi:hypothetical protein